MDRALNPVDHFADPILAQRSAAPVVRGDLPEGDNWWCGHCRAQLIAEKIVDEQMWDIAFECFKCKRLSASLARPRGMALQRDLCVLENGVHPMEAPVDIGWTTVASAGTKAQRAAETGERGSTFRGGEAAVQRVRPESIDGWIGTFRELFGEGFDRLCRRDTAGKASPTPPKKRHGLMVLVDNLKRANEPPVKGRDDPAVAAIAEAVSVLRLLERWRGHPMWATLIKQMEDGTRYEHNVILLLVASLLEDYGNGVNINEDLETPTADLHLVTGPGSNWRAAVEIKTPQALLDRSDDLTPEEAFEIVETAIRKTRKESDGQLSLHTGILALGGFRLSTPAVNTLEAAAHRYLEDRARAGRRKQLMAIVIASVGFGFERSTDNERPKDYLRTGLYYRLAQNPAYEGPAQLSTDGATPQWNDARIPGPPAHARVASGPAPSRRA